jgi:hypothetical protein
MRDRRMSLAGAGGLVLLATLLLLQASGMAPTALAAVVVHTRSLRHPAEPPIRQSTDAVDGPIYSLVNGPLYGPASTPIYDLGAPTSEGTSVRMSLAAPTDQAMLTFSIRGPGPGYVALFVGDQWYDVDAALYRRGQGSSLIDGEPIVVLDRGERRRVQFIRPEDVLLPSMPPGDYVLVVEPRAASSPDQTADFAAGRDFLVRVAVGAPLCATTAADGASSTVQSAGTHPNDVPYQFGLAVEPASVDRTALLTFTGVVSPPFTDLFDFTWSVDGVPVDGVTGPIYQQPGRDLRPTPNGRHTITLMARGAHQYHDPTDPSLSHLPLDGGTVAVACTFRLSN